MKYKVGDKVRVRSDLKVNHDYGNITLLDGFMKDYRGEIAEVIEVISVSKNYLLKIDDLHYSFYFSEEMIQGLAEETPKKFHVYDTVKHEIFGLGTVIGTDGGIAKYKVDFDNLDYSLLVDGHTCYCLPNELTLVEAYTGGEAD